MSTRYKPEELDILLDSEAEQKRTFKIFQDLKELALAGKDLTELEKNFLCKAIKVSLLEEDDINNYECCDNYKFKFLYLTYFKDLSGGSTYVKPKKLERVQVSIEEAQSDLKYLEEKALEWLEVIKKENHSEQLLLQKSKEARLELKALEESPEFKSGFLFGGRNRFNQKRNAILLQSKYLYCMAKEIFESFDQHEFIIRLNNQDIEINEYSIVHILNRHYSQITKQYPTGKTFHSEDFSPRYLNKQLATIFEEIDKSEILKGQSLRKIAFKHKGTTYLVWTQLQTKSVKGQGNIQYNRLETFYPVGEKDVLDDLDLNYDCIAVNGELSVYVRKTAANTGSCKNGG